MPRQISRRSFVSKLSKFFLSFGSFSFAQRVMAQLPNQAFWRHRVASGPASINLTIASNTQNYNIFTAAGSPTSACNVTVTINSGIVVGSSVSSAYAMETGAFPSGSTLHIINQGYIVGRGGDGGYGGGSTSSSSGNPHPAFGGYPGGPALSLQLPITITNANGYIYSGGGGGGGGGGQKSYEGGGGGGGAGDSVGWGGYRSGSFGALSLGGLGENRGQGGGHGGNGGGPGASGLSGGNGGSTGDARPAAGGGGTGSAITRNGNSITWVSGSNRVYGSIV